MKKYLPWLFSCIICTSVATAEQPQDAASIRRIALSAHASIEAKPDLALISIEVNASAKKALDAKKQVDERVVKYVSFLRAQGVDQADINTANLSTQPEYDYTQQGKAIPKGFAAVRQVTVKVRQLDKLNSLLDNALKLDLNEINGIELSVAEPEEYQTKARKAAIDKAIYQAKQLAAGFGGSLGPVYSVNYRSTDFRPHRLERAVMFSAVSKKEVDHSYQKQAIHFEDSVDVVFELKLNP